MKTNHRIRHFLMAIFLTFSSSAFAGTGTWLTSPVNGNWNNALNWSPMTVPNGPADIATFGSSSVTNISLSADTEVNGIVFNPFAHLTHYLITAGPTRTLSISGTGITNDSGTTQTFVTATDGSGHAGTIELKGDASAGSMTVFNNSGANTRMFGARSGATIFFDTSSAGSATINNNSGLARGAAAGETVFNDTSTAGSATINNAANSSNGGSGGSTSFNDSSTADNATINNREITLFSDTSTAGSATINNEAPSFLIAFLDASNARSATITNHGAAFVTHGSPGSFMVFQDAASAASAAITNEGGTGNGGGGGGVDFQGGNAGNATIINNGGAGAGAQGGRTDFDAATQGTPGGRSSAGSATLIANGGTRGGAGGRIIFLYNSNGGRARVEVFGNGSLDVGDHNAPGMTIGSIEGTGKVFLGANELSVGNNGLSTVFSGVIQDQGGFSDATGGSLTKVGKGTLTLSNANTYTSDTNINVGVLQVDGSIASPNTFVNPGGTLSGTGTVRGNLSNSGIVSPGDSPGTLHVGGNYSQASGGTLEIEIAGLFSFDQLAVAGTANLSGILDVTLDGYTEHAGDMFTILKSSGLSGNFLNLDLPELSNGLVFHGARDFE
jgi:autotransporter-associated beta strand protein